MMLKSVTYIREQYELVVGTLPSISLGFIP